MPNYRRVYRPGGLFFLTLVTHERQPLFASAMARSLLGACLRECQRQWPFDVDAIVLLPDHLHLLVCLPQGDSNYSQRVGWVKKEFTTRWLASGLPDTPVSVARQQERRHGLWQPRFWEHTIRDEDDLAKHFDYIHYNPVKHGHVACPKDWPYSSFHRYVKSGHYPRDWGCTHKPPPDFKTIAATVGE